MSEKLNNILLTFLVGIAVILAQSALPLSAADATASSKREPVRRTAPDYPRAAERKGIEGYVVLQYTVLADGKIEDPVVVEATPAGIFDKAALKAVQKWRYRKAMTDTPGVQVRLTFNDINKPSH